MLYQLPSGKVIYLSTEEYLSLSDDEIHNLAHSEYGEEPSYHMYYGGRKEPTAAAVKASKPPGLDYTPDSEETSTSGPTSIDTLPDG